jgi:imidazolonepropionase-like amidohydrolase
MSGTAKHFFNWKARRKGAKGAPWLLALILAGGGIKTSAAALLLTNGIIHTVTGGTLSSGQVLIENGTISAVGTNLPASGAPSVNLEGLHVYPGLISLDTSLGLGEISGVRATQDATESGQFTPDVESWIAVNPDSELIPVARANGTAYFEPVPKGGTVPGQSALVTVEGWTTEQRTVKKPIALHFFWPNMDLNLRPRRAGAAPDANLKNLDEQGRDRRRKVRAATEFFDDALAYSHAKEAATKSGSRSFETIPAWEAMLPFVRGELPVVVHADEVRQIRGAVAWAVTNHYKVYLADGRDAWMAAGLLASNGIPVIYSRTLDLPARDTEPYDVHYRAPAALHEAGVQVTFSVGCEGMSPEFARNLPYFAAQAVAFGLPAAEALKGITLYPAQLAGVSDKLGSIEPGKTATLFVADGDILDIRSNVKRMWIAGREISLESRHTRLYEKYRNRPRAAVH